MAVGIWSLPAHSVLVSSSRRRHTRFDCDWSSDVCSSDLLCAIAVAMAARRYVHRHLDTVALLKTLGATRAFTLAMSVLQLLALALLAAVAGAGRGDRERTRLNSRHSQNSYAAFCLKKKKATRRRASMRRLPGTRQHLPFTRSPQPSKIADTGTLVIRMRRVMPAATRPVSPAPRIRP